MTNDCIFERGQTLFRLGKVEQALSLALEGLAGEPEDPNLLLLLSSCHLRAGRFEEAETAARACVSAMPDWSYAHYALAEALVRTDRDEEALDANLSAIELEPEVDSEFYALATRILMKLGRSREAFDMVSKGLSLNFECHACHLEKALTLIYTRRSGEAKYCLQETLDLFPESAFALALLGAIDGKFGNAECAKESLQAALELEPEGWFAQHALKVVEEDLREKPYSFEEPLYDPKTNRFLRRI